MVTEIVAKSLLNNVPQPDGWFGLRYNMNLYRGCQHQCIYCDSRSECYQIEDFSKVLVKANALVLLEKELQRKRVRGTIGTGSMNDPYMPVEMQLNMTGRALEIIAGQHFPVHVLTKSDLVLRDLETLVEIAKVYAAVSFTVTTADDDLCRTLEPGAPVASRRMAAMAKLAQRGITTGILLMPVLPFIEDNLQNITAIVEQAADNGAGYILASFGMTLRDRQRAYYYEKLDKHFPGLRQTYQQRFGGQYFAPSPNAARLEAEFKEECERHSIRWRMPVYEPGEKQLRLF